MAHGAAPTQTARRAGISGRTRRSPSPRTTTTGPTCRGTARFDPVDPVLSEHSAGRISVGVAAVMAEDAAEAFVASDNSRAGSLAGLPERQRDDVVETLVVALVVVVLDVFRHDGSRVPLAHRHDVTPAT